MESISVVAAFAAGLVSFASPCVLPVVPAILTMVTGTNLTRAEPNPAATARDTVLFVLGFGVVFIVLGASATTVGSAIFRNQAALARVTGALILAMGLYLLAGLAINAPWLYQERRFHPRLDRFGPFAAPVAGVAFGFGWTPCIGPVLTSVLALAATQDTAGQGAALLTAYAAGLGVPFVVTAVAFSRLSPLFTWLKRHLRQATVLTGSMMTAFGLLLVTGQLPWITTRLQDGLRAIGLEQLIFLGTIG